MKLDPKLQAQLGEMFKVAAPTGELSDATTPQLLMVEVDDIQTGVQPRTQFDENELRELENSIGELARAGQGIGGSGILQPLLARTLPDQTLHLVAGERRLRAAKAAGISRVPVVIGVAIDQTDAFEQAIVENLLRADLLPLEEARALQRWMESAKLSLRGAARKLGRDKGYLENRLRLLSMGEDVQNMVSFRKNTLPHARLIDAVNDQRLRQKLITMVVEDGVGKREIETIITRFERENEGGGWKDTSENRAEADGQQQKARRNAAFVLPVQDAWKALQKASKSLEADEAIRLAEGLEKLAAQLRKAAPSK